MKRATLLLIALIVATSMASAQQIYMTGTGGNEIWVANRDGSGIPSLLHSNAATGSQGPAGLIAALDPVNQLFYGGGNHAEIDVASVDGSGTPSVLWADAGDEHLGITADPPTGLLYWTTESGGAIRSAAWDGSGGISDIFAGLADGPVGITLDPATGTLYWTTVRGPNIYTGAADGSSGPTVLYDAADGVVGPRQIVFLSGMLYWTEHNAGAPGSGRIVSAPASGAGPLNTLHTVPAPFLPSGIDIDASTLFWNEFEQPWTSPYNDRVMTGAADGSGSPAILFAGDFGGLRGIAAGVNIIFGAAPVAVEVPVLSPWSVALLIVLFAGSAVVILRRIGTI